MFNTNFVFQNNSRKKTVGNFTPSFGNSEESIAYEIKKQGKGWEYSGEFISLMSNSPFDLLKGLKNGSISHPKDWGYVFENLIELWSGDEFNVLEAFLESFGDKLSKDYWMDAINYLKKEDLKSNPLLLFSIESIKKFLGLSYVEHDKILDTYYNKWN